MKKRIGLIFLITMLLPISVWAEAAPVEEASSSSSSTGTYYAGDNADPEVPLSQDNSSASTYSSEPAFNPNDPASLIAKLNAMQTEIQRLRGKMEIQSHEIAALKKQQTAYFNDLDQRITSLSTGKKATQPILSLDDSDKTTTTAAAPAATTKVVKTPISIPAATSTEPASANETVEYNAAYLLIEHKQFAKATDAMNAFLKAYPNGSYASNAHYWLGELSVTQHQDDIAIKEFTIVIDRYPTSNKVSAALLKRGIAYANLGKTSEAKKDFLKVKQLFPNSVTSELAEQRLSTLPGAAPTGVPNYH